MTIKPSTKPADLPPEVRQHILDQLRSQLGHDHYREMESLLGEDGMLSFALDQIRNQAQEFTQSKKPTKKSTPDEILLAALSGVFVVALLVLACSRPDILKQYGHLWWGKCVGGVGLGVLACWGVRPSARADGAVGAMGLKVLKASLLACALIVAWGLYQGIYVGIMLLASGG